MCALRPRLRPAPRRSARRAAGAAPDRRLLNRVGEPLRAGLQSRGLDRIAALLGGHPALFRLFALLAAVGDLVGF